MGFSLILRAFFSFPNERQFIECQFFGSSEKKGGVFALNDDMKPRMYGDMEAFAQELRDMGYSDVRLIDTAQEAFGSHGRAAAMMLGASRMLVGRK